MGAGATGLSNPKRGDLLVITLVSLTFFIALKIHQYFAFGVHGELANFEYMIWSTLEGRFLALDSSGTSFFSQHVSPILLGLVPLYAVFRSPLMFLVVQACAAGLAVIPLYLLVDRCLESRASAIAITLSYFFSRVLNYGLMYDFHMEIFFPLLFFCAFWAMEGHRWGWFYLFLLLALSVKEDAGIASLGLGLYLVSTRRRKHGLAAVVISATWLLLSFLVVIPWFRRGLEHTGYMFASYWSGYGDTLGEVLKNMLNPLRHVGVLFTLEKLGKTFNLLSVFLFLPLLSWRVALFLVVPSWFILYSSDHPLLIGASIYYGLLITPFLFYASVLVLRNIATRWPKSRSRWVPILAALVLLVHFGNSRIFKQLRPTSWRIEPRFQTAERMIERIPTSAPVAAQVDLQSHLPVRAERHLIRREIGSVDYLLFDVEGNPWPLSKESNARLADSLRCAPEWKVLEETGGFLLMRRQSLEGS